MNAEKQWVGGLVGWWIGEGAAADTNPPIHPYPVINFTATSPTTWRLFAEILSIVSIVVW
jgi:hypothetical protein